MPDVYDKEEWPDEVMQRVFAHHKVTSISQLPDCDCPCFDGSGGCQYAITQKPGGPDKCAHPIDWGSH